MAARSTQSVAEVLGSTKAYARSTQSTVEILGSTKSHARSTQSMAEILGSTKSHARSTQSVAEILGHILVPKARSTQSVAEILGHVPVPKARSTQSVAEILARHFDAGFARSTQSTAEVLVTRSGYTDFPNPYSEVIKRAVYYGEIRVPIAATPWASPFGAISAFKNTAQFATFDDGNGLKFDASGNALTTNMCVATPTAPYLYEMNSGGSAIGSRFGLGPMHFNNYMWGFSPPSWAQLGRSLSGFQELAAVASSPGPTTYGGAPLSQTGLLFNYQTPMDATANPIPFWFNNNSYVFDGLGNRLIGPYLGYIRESEIVALRPDTALIPADMIAAGTIWNNPTLPFGGSFSNDVMLCKAPCNSAFWQTGGPVATCFKQNGYETGPVGLLVPKVSTFMFYGGGAFADRIVLPLDLGPYSGMPSFRQIAYKPHFDDPALDAIWMNPITAYQIKSTAAGWLIIIPNNTFRSYGGSSTFILVEPDWSSYKYINIMPQDAGSSKAFGGNGTDLSAFIDLAGVFWLSTTNPHFFSSYLLYFPIAITVPGSKGLPCFNPCYPTPIGVTTI